jgi:hypothetical protein
LTNDYGFIFTEKSVTVAQGVLAILQIFFVWLNGLLVIALYSKTGSKNGKHAAITDSSNISALLYVGVQVFEHMYGCQFCVIPEATTPF